MKIFKNKDLVFISRTLVVKASGNTLTSTNVLKWMTFPQTFQPSFSNGCLLSSPSPFGPLWIPTRLGALQELDCAAHKKSLSWSYSLACVLNSQITSRIVLGQVQAVGSLLKLPGNGCACTELPRHSAKHHEKLAGCDTESMGQNYVATWLCSAEYSPPPSWLWVWSCVVLWPMAWEQMWHEQMWPSEACLHGSAWPLVPWDSPEGKLPPNSCCFFSLDSRLRKVSRLELRPQKSCPRWLSDSQVRKINVCCCMLVKLWVYLLYSLE